jgi:pimeloyl-ACP methyl ester carboxylesterase
MKERAVAFGKDRCLSGIVTEPEGQGSHVGVLLLNAGILHRVGPALLHVRLARALAGEGFPVLRFDSSGIGESEARSDAVPYEQRIVGEAQAGMDLLGELGTKRFVVFGICSGADNGFRVALGDERIVGAVLPAFLSFGSRGYLMERYFGQLLTREFWLRAVQGGVDVRSTLRNAIQKLRASPSPSTPEPGDESQFWRMPPSEKVRSELRNLAARGVQLLFIYSHGSPAEFNYRKILRPEQSALGEGAPIDVMVVKHTDHTFSPLHHQQRIVNAVVDWTKRVAARDGS